MAVSPVNSRDVSLQTAGISSRTINTTLDVETSSQFFTKLKNTGSVTPSSIIITANDSLFTSPTYAWEYYNSTTGLWVTISGVTTKSYNLTSATFTTHLASQVSPAASVTYRVTVSQLGYTTISSAFQIYQVQEGNDGTNGTNPVTGYLTNESIVLPSSSAGVVTDYSPGAGTFKVFSGTTDVTTSSTFSIVGEVPAELDISIVTNTGEYTVVSIGNSYDSRSVTLRAVYGSTTVDKVLIVTKAKNGVDSDADLTVPNIVTGVTAITVETGVEIKWTAVSNTRILGYWVQIGGASYGTGSLLTVFVTDNILRIPYFTHGTYNVFVRARSPAGIESAAASTAVSLIINTPAAVQNLVKAISGTDFILDWGEPVSDNTRNYLLDFYEIRYGSTASTYGTSTFLSHSKVTKLQAPVSYGTTRRYYITPVDVKGGYGTTTTIDVEIILPAAPSIFRAEVIDNNVLLNWSNVQVAGQLNISTYEIRRGPVFSSATVLGTKSGLFTSIFETASGTYTYWVVAIDSAGNYGTEKSVVATVSQPPDYILLTNYVSDFTSGGFGDAGGTTTPALSNAVLENDGSPRVIMPLNLTEQFGSHFSTRSWTTPDAQVVAGYPIYAQPTLNTGYYEEVIDYGTIIAASKITVNYTGEMHGGTPTVSLMISIKTNVGDAWTDYTANGIYVTNFRYIRVRITSTNSDSKSIYALTNLGVVLDAKLKNDAGTVACLSSDNSAALLSDNGITCAAAGGTAVILSNVDFVDITSITLTPLSTTSVVAVYSIIDTPNPTGFKVYLFNSTTGARASGSCAWAVKGY